MHLADSLVALQELGGDRERQSSCQSPKVCFCPRAAEECRLPTTSADELRLLHQTRRARRRVERRHRKPSTPVASCRSLRARREPPIALPVSTTVFRAGSPECRHRRLLTGQQVALPRNPGPTASSPANAQKLAS